MCASNFFNVQSTLEQILNDLSKNGDVGALESLAKFIPDKADVDAAIEADSKPEIDPPKDKVARDGGVADPKDAIVPELQIIEIKSNNITIFYSCMADNRLDSHIALAEARAGDLDAACARIDHMGNQSMRAETLRRLAEGIDEWTAHKRAERAGRAEQ